VEAIAAYALKLERAASEQNRSEAKEWRKLMREIVVAELIND